MGFVFTSNTKRILTAFGLKLDIPAKAQAELDAMAEARTEKTKLALREAAGKLRPELKKCLRTNYARCGLGHVSGDLEKASVDEVVILFGEKALIIRMGEGFKTNVYARAGAYKFGGIHGKVGKRAKKNIKRGLIAAGRTKTSDGKFSLITPRSPFFTIIDDQILKLESLQAGFVAEAFKKSGLPVVSHG